VVKTVSLCRASIHIRLHGENEILKPLTILAYLTAFRHIKINFFAWMMDRNFSDGGKIAVNIEDPSTSSQMKESI